MLTVSFRNRAAAALAFALAGAVVGCGLLGTPVPASRVLNAAQFSDIPAPRGFVLEGDAGRSYTYAEGGGGPAALRMGRLSYAGSGDVEETLGWLEEQMLRPLHGWTEARRLEGGADAASTLFLRGEERCLVTVRREGSVTRVVVERNTERTRRS